jgi:hypothetical protein
MATPIIVVVSGAWSIIYAMAIAQIPRAEIIGGVNSATIEVVIIANETSLVVMVVNAAIYRDIRNGIEVNASTIVKIPWSPTHIIKHSVSAGIKVVISQIAYIIVKIIDIYTIYCDVGVNYDICGFWGGFWGCVVITILVRFRVIIHNFIIIITLGLYWCGPSKKSQ